MNKGIDYIILIKPGNEMLGENQLYNKFYHIVTLVATKAGFGVKIIYNRKVITPVAEVPRADSEGRIRIDSLELLIHYFQGRKILDNSVKTLVNI